MNRAILMFGLLAVLHPVRTALGGDGAIRHVNALYARTFEHPTIGSRFDITATITFISERMDDAPDSKSVMLALKDDTGATIVYDYTTATNAVALCPGDTVRLTGTIEVLTGNTRAGCKSISVVSRGAPPAPVRTTIGELLAGRHDCRLTQVSGIVRDAFQDEIDPRWIYLALSRHGATIYAAFIGQDKIRYDNLIGAEATICGICDPSNEGCRRQLGRMLITGDAPDMMSIRTPTADVFAVPELEDTRRLRVSDINSLGLRRISGSVLATWHDVNLLMRSPSGKIIRAELAEGPVPPCGTAIELAGLPTTDLFNVNFTHATWRPSGSEIPTNAAPTEAGNLLDMMTDRQGRPRVNPSYHGRRIRLSGTVRTLPAPGNNDGRFSIDCGRFNIAIDVSMTPEVLRDLSIGSEIEVIGVCLMDTDSWRANALFPKVTGFTIILRDADDLHVVRRPSWWTPGRLLMVIAALFAVLLGILAWNVALHRVAARKGRELMEEQLGHVTAELKTEERTRLAVELHDSLAQNLTGVSLEIDTAAKVLDESPASTKTHLTVAARSLKSCRDELRNCLWDLRNRALEERTMDEAIRQTLAPHVAGIELAIRFNVPRERISDNTAHAILRIIRELTLNGIRHGGATRIRIAGSVEGDRMLFSVRDNGCGFDPDAATGFDRGHYGLLGIRERVDEFEGEFAIASKPGSGTKATISLTVPQENRQT